MNNLKYWIWLSLAMGPGSTAPHRLLPAFNNNIEELYEADEDAIQGIRLTAKQKGALLNKSLDEAELIIDWCNNHHVSILCYEDAQYPKRLAAIPDAPIVLYYIGNLYNIDEQLCLATVGTREMTRYGHDSAYAFSHDLARSGAIIVSGLAAGIDTVCHRAALDAGGKTVAVIGCRINKVYPAQNRDLMAEIARKGLLITEYHPFFKTSPANFPKRNRIISGLCQATIVFEADAGSGSLITARIAHKQARTIYALPGNIGNSGAVGTNALISDGARIITRSADIIDEFIYLYPQLKKPLNLFDYSPVKHTKDSFGTVSTKASSPLPKRNTEKPIEENVITEEKDPDISELPEIERNLYALLSLKEPTPIDTIKLDHFSSGEVMSALTMLELKGYIKQLPGNKYIKLIPNKNL